MEAFEIIKDKVNVIYKVRFFHFWWLGAIKPLLGRKSGQNRALKLFYLLTIPR